MDRVLLSLPDTSVYLPLVRLVLGGVATRQNMSFDAMDDLQLAVENLLSGRWAAGRRITMQVELQDDQLDVRVGSLSDESLRCELSAPGGAGTSEPQLLSMCTMLRLLVDGYRVEEEAPGSYSVHLTKQCR